MPLALTFSRVAVKSATGAFAPAGGRIACRRSTHRRQRMKRFITDRLAFIQDQCRGKRVLDVGCVNHSVEFVEHDDWLHGKIAAVASSVVGIDIEKEAVEELNRRGYTAIVANAEDFNLRDRYPEGFEVVVAGEIIEHLVNPGLFLQNLRCHLAPGGKIILTTPNAYGFIFFLEVLLLGHETLNDDHTMTFSKKNMTRFLEKCGFEVTGFTYVNEVGRNRQEWCAKFLYRPLWLLQCLFSLIRSGLSRGTVYIAVPKVAQPTDADAAAE